MHFIRHPDINKFFLWFLSTLLFLKLNETKTKLYFRGRCPKVGLAFCHRWARLWNVWKLLVSAKQGAGWCLLGASTDLSATQGGFGDYSWTFHRCFRHQLSCGSENRANNSGAVQWNIRDSCIGTAGIWWLAQRYNNFHLCSSFGKYFLIYPNKSGVAPVSCTIPHFEVKWRNCAGTGSFRQYCFLLTEHGGLHTAH